MFKVRGEFTDVVWRLYSLPLLRRALSISYSQTDDMGLLEWATHLEDLEDEASATTKSNAIKDLAKVLEVTHFTPQLFNTLWICPLAQIKYHISRKSHTLPETRESSKDFWSRNACQMVRQFREGYDREPQKPGAHYHYEEDREPPKMIEIAPELAEGIKKDEIRARARDGDICVLTEQSRTKVAHMIPYSILSGSYDARERIHRSLRPFWGEDAFKEAFALLDYNKKYKTTPLPEQDRIENMITLDYKVVELLKQGLIALKPLSPTADGKSITLELWWLSTTPTTPRPGYRYGSEVDAATKPAAMKRGQFSSVDGVYLAKMVDMNTGKCEALRSGDRFEVTTKDPETHPLPSYHLLELAWCLQRISGMSRGAEYHDFLYDEENDDEYYERIEAEREECS